MPSRVIPARARVGRELIGTGHAHAVQVDSVGAAVRVLCDNVELASLCAVSFAAGLADTRKLREVITCPLCVSKVGTRRRGQHPGRHPWRTPRSIASR